MSQERRKPAATTTRHCSGLKNAATGQRGLTYPEVLAAVFLVAVLLVPAMDALRSSSAGASFQEQQLHEYYALRAMAERIKSRPFGELESAAIDETTPTTLSDTIAMGNGETVSVDVYIAGHDADNADLDNNPRTGVDDGILWVRVAISTQQRLEWLVAQ